MKVPRQVTPDRAPAVVLPRRLGERIAALRVANGDTQAELAQRVAISRVALSNLESGRSVPGERTVTLLASVFGFEPYELVEGTDYPVAKADRLPLVTTRYTEVALQLALLERDLCWLETAPSRMVAELVSDWTDSLHGLLERSADPGERDRLAVALAQLRSLSS